MEKLKRGVYFDGIWFDPEKPQLFPKTYRSKFHYDRPPKAHITTDNHRWRVELDMGFAGVVSNHSKFGVFRCNDSCDCNNVAAIFNRLMTNPVKQKDGSYIQSTYPPSEPWAIREVCAVLKAIGTDFRYMTDGDPLTVPELLEAMRARDENIREHMKVFGFHTKGSNVRLYEDMWKELKIDYPRIEGSGIPFVDPSYLKRFSKVKAFAKVEMLNPSKYPRNISPRHPKFNLVWGCFVKPLEQFVMGMDGGGKMREYYPGRTDKFRNRMIGKCYNSVQRGMLLQQKLELFSDRFRVKPVVFSTDCSGYDAHCTRALIKAEHDVLMANAYPTWKNYLRKLGEQMTTNKGHSSGNRFEVDGARMSGDMHTGGGNCWNMAAKICAFFKWLSRRYPGINKRWDCCIDGDDTLVFVHPDDEMIINTEMPYFFTACGHELKIENVSRGIEDIVWCQSRYVRVQVSDTVLENCNSKKHLNFRSNEVWMAVQDPSKVFKSLGSHLHMRTYQQALEYTSANCRAYSKLYSGIPVYNKLAHAGAMARKGILASSGLFYQMGIIGHCEHEANANTLSDFCRAFNWDCAMVESAETELAMVDPEMLRRAYDNPTLAPQLIAN